MQLNRCGMVIAGLLVAQGAHLCEARRTWSDIQAMEKRRTMRIRIAVASVEKSLDDLLLSSKGLYSDIITVAYSWRKTVYAATKEMSKHNDKIKKMYKKLEAHLESPAITRLVSTLTALIDSLTTIVNQLPFGSRKFTQEGDLKRFYRRKIKRGLKPKLKELKAAVKNAQSVDLPKLQLIRDKIATISLYMEKTLIKELTRQIDPDIIRFPFFSFLFRSYYFSNPPEVVENNDDDEDDSWSYSDDNDDDTPCYRSDDGSCPPGTQKYCCSLKDGEQVCRLINENESCGQGEETFCCRIKK